MNSISVGVIKMPPCYRIPGASSESVAVSLAAEIPAPAGALMDVGEGVSSLTPGAAGAGVWDPVLVAAVSAVISI